jgi:hypothetical protein
MRSEERLPEGDTAKGSVAGVVTTLICAAFSLAFFLFGCFIFFVYGLGILLGMSNDDCCYNLLNCRPCGHSSTSDYPFLLLGLTSFFISIAPWVAARLYRRSKASENRRIEFE